MFGRLLDYISPGSCSVNSLCVQVLRSAILVALLHSTRAVGVSESLRRCIQEVELRNFRRGRHLYSAGRPSRWASAHILVIVYNGSNPSPPSKLHLRVGVLDPHVIHGSSGPPNPHPKRHLDRFSRFCRAYDRADRVMGRPHLRSVRAHKISNSTKFAVPGLAVHGTTLAPVKMKFGRKELTMKNCRLACDISSWSVYFETCSHPAGFATTERFCLRFSVRKRAMI